MSVINRLEKFVNSIEEQLNDFSSHIESNEAFTVDLAEKLLKEAESIKNKVLLNNGFMLGLCDKDQKPYVENLFSKVKNHPFSGTLTECLLNEIKKINFYIQTNPPIELSEANELNEKTKAIKKFILSNEVRLSNIASSNEEITFFQSAFLYINEYSLYKELDSQYLVRYNRIGRQDPKRLRRFSEQD